MQKQSHYIRLAVYQTANLEEIKKAAQNEINKIKQAFHKKDYHFFNILKSASEKDFKIAAKLKIDEIKLAYKILSTPELRTTYDKYLKDQRTQSQIKLLKKNIAKTKSNDKAIIEIQHKKEVKSIKNEAVKDLNSIRQCLVCNYNGEMKSWLFNYTLPIFLIIIGFLFYMIPGIVFLIWG